MKVDGGRLFKYGRRGREGLYNERGWIRVNEMQLDEFLFRREIKEPVPGDKIELYIERLKGYNREHNAEMNRTHGGTWADASFSREESGGQLEEEVGGHGPLPLVAEPVEVGGPQFGAASLPRRRQAV